MTNDQKMTLEEIKEAIRSQFAGSHFNFEMLDHASDGCLRDGVTDREQVRQSVQGLMDDQQRQADYEDSKTAMNVGRELHQLDMLVQIYTSAAEVFIRRQIVRLRGADGDQLEDEWFDEMMPLPAEYADIDLKFARDAAAQDVSDRQAKAREIMGKLRVAWTRHKYRL